MRNRIRTAFIAASATALTIMLPATDALARWRGG